LYVCKYAKSISNQDFLPIIIVPKNNAAPHAMKRKIIDKMLKWEEYSAGKTALLIDRASESEKAILLNCQIHKFLYSLQK